ncbi:hypothetical protein LV779_14860 [Streptomyces thinghirensis]|nr:hypothetical protein [Streptomyces thinghirensis]
MGRPDRPADITAAFLKVQIEAARAPSSSSTPWPARCPPADYRLVMPPSKVFRLSPAG